MKTIVTGVLNTIVDTDGERHARHLHHDDQHHGDVDTRRRKRTEYYCQVVAWDRPI
jgi:hypothetical protein